MVGTFLPPEKKNVVREKQIRTNPLNVNPRSLKSKNTFRSMHPLTDYVTRVDLSSIRVRENEHVSSSNREIPHIVSVFFLQYFFVLFLFFFVF